ncbi:MAG: DUF4177 domain-containing protein [Paracoccaceae bacterium]
MQCYEFKVVPAPRRGEKARGVKSTEDRFALALTGLMNRLGAEGWDYVRADALPCDERVGLTGSKTTYQNMLVFRRPLLAGAEPESMAEDRIPELRAKVAPVAAAPVTEVPAVRLGAAEQPLGAAPSLGPAKPDLAAE